MCIRDRYDRRPEYTIMVDKIEVKKYVAEKLGPEYVISTLGFWNTPDDIDFEALPNRFVLKCNHNSGGLYLCRDKSTMDVEAVKKKLRKSCLLYTSIHPSLIVPITEE